VCVAATDPLNLAGTLLTGDKVPAVAGNRLLFRDGILVATLVAGQFNFLPALGADTDTDAEAKTQARMRLARRY
jgi:ATP-dependent Lhr-like helicase